MVTVYGYCGLSPAEIASMIESGLAGDFVDASGHFVIVYRPVRMRTLSFRPDQGLSAIP
jgi:hypothetical protein